MKAVISYGHDLFSPRATAFCLRSTKNYARSQPKHCAALVGWSRNQLQLAPNRPWTARYSWPGVDPGDLLSTKYKAILNGFYSETTYIISFKKRKTNNKQLLEIHGGEDAFINIKYMIPTYESCVLN